jgi:hypothetical protein
MGMFLSSPCQDHQALAMDHRAPIFVSLHSCLAKPLYYRVTPLLTPMWSSLEIQSSFTELCLRTLRTIIALRQSVLLMVSKSALLIPTTEKMPPQPVACIVSLGHRILEPGHTIDKIRLRSFENQMVMVPHQRIGIHLPTRPRHDFFKCSFKCLPVRVSPHNPVQAVPSRHKMIHFYAWSRMALS